MNPDRIRLTVEVVGISALVLSLLFVGFELKQTRDMNLAELHHNRLALFHNNMLSMLESDHALMYLEKLVYTEENGVSWRPGELTDLERAAALANAEARIAAWDIEYRFMEQGFPMKTIEDFESEVARFAREGSAIRGVWPLWSYPGEDDQQFYVMMNRVLSEK
jgi:hypothetical protein